MRYTLPLMTVALALAGCSVTIAPAASDRAGECQNASGTCSVAEHDAHQPVLGADLDSRIHDYLVAHPEAVQEAQTALARRQAEARLASGQKALADNRALVFADATDPVIGNPAGDVTIVEFFDDECPFCKQLAPSLDALVKADPGVRVVLKEYPILGPVSETAARYALAATRQGADKYSAFHHRMMADPTREHRLTEAHILENAAAAGLDVERLKRDAAEAAVSDKIGTTRALAGKLAITGTPGLIIGDQMQSGAMTMDALKSAVAEARSRKTALDVNVPR